MAPPVQLSAAVHASQLIPGDPEESARLGQSLARFAEVVHEARSGLGRVGLGGWVGATSAAVEADLVALGKRLAAAELAFDDAGAAVTRYAGVHSESLARAGDALRMYQEAAPASAVAHGMVATASIALPVADPDAVLARAGRILAVAREDLEAAANRLANDLEEATKAAPLEPGFLAGLKRAITSLTEGALDSVVELGPAAVGLVQLAARLNPERVLYDPKGWLHDSDAFFTPIVEHPDQFGKQLIDWNTWKTDPARALGKILPDIATLGAGVLKEGALRGAEADEKLITAAEAKEEAERAGGLSGAVRGDTVDRQLSELGLDPHSAAGLAARGQIQILRNPDQWVPVHLHDGDLIAVARGGEVIVPISGDLTTDGRVFCEAIQDAPERAWIGDGVPSPPELLDRVYLYRVHGGIDGATSTALANPEFGAGGGARLSVGDFDDALDDGTLVPVGEHTFDPGTLRSGFEDPRYRQVDPSLPIHALDPDHERVLGRFHAAKDHLQETGRNTVLVGTQEFAAEQAERGER
jgi:type VII secretion system ESX-1 substrate